MLSQARAPGLCPAPRAAEHICNKTSIAAFVSPWFRGEAGMVMYHPAYLAHARIVQSVPFHFIADEIAVGMGRTERCLPASGSEFSVSETGENISPDFLCLSKGLSGGYLPLSVVLATDAIYQAFMPTGSQGFASIPIQEIPWPVGGSGYPGTV